MMKFFGDSSESEEDLYRRSKKPHRRPVVLKDVVRGDSIRNKLIELESVSGVPSRESSVSKTSYTECFACKKPIYKDIFEYVEALEKPYHPECFQCTKCSKPLKLEGYQEHKGKLYCEMDYNELILPKCYVCTKPIYETPVRVLQRNYHPIGCFTCTKCSQPACPFTFHERNGAVYDDECFHELFSPRCANCNDPIKDQKEMIRALGTTFHKEHFVCFECAVPLPANNYRKKNGQLYCEDDYHKLFTLRCSFCDEPIRHRGITALGKNWHADCCLRCSTCNKILKEDNYISEKGKAYCKSDWIKEFAPKCAQLDCQRPVSGVLNGDAVVALGGTYHPVCFICKECNLILDEKTYHEFEGNPFCYVCYHNKTCTDCLRTVEERKSALKKVDPVRRSESSSRRSLSLLNAFRPSSTRAKSNPK